MRGLKRIAIREDKLFAWSCYAILNDEQTLTNSIF